MSAIALGLYLLSQIAVTEMIDHTSAIHAAVSIRADKVKIVHVVEK